MVNHLGQVEHFLLAHLDETEAILATFKDYTQAFETLDPQQVEPYFHQPAMLITTAKVSILNNADQIKRVFWILFADLTLKDFKCSTIDAIQVAQVSENQAIVSGTATRYDVNNLVLDRFGLNYTLRKVDGTWKIIVGVLHDYW
jgi:Domain of unknown function (DUF4440)